MRRGWIFFLLAAVASAQEFSEGGLDAEIGTLREAYKSKFPVLVDSVQRIEKWGLRAERAAPALVEVCWIPDADFQAALRAALRAVGPAAMREVAKVVKSKPRHRKWATSLLEAWARLPVAVAPGAEAPLVEFLGDENPLVRRAAARSLAAQGAIVPRLVTVLGDKNARRRESAAFALAAVEPPPLAALAALVTAAGDKDPLVREQAMRALAWLPPSPETFACLWAALSDPADAVVAVAVEELAKRGGDVGRYVATFDGDETVARHATEVLVRIGVPAWEPVAEALKSGSPKRKVAAARCLGRIGAERDLPLETALGPALGDADATVRLAAAEALGFATPVVGARALDALLKAAADADPRVKAAAVAAATRAAPQDARVVELARKAKDDADPGVKAAAAASSATTVPACVAVLKDAAAPAAARVLAAERLRSLEGPLAATVETLGKVVADRALAPDVRAAAAAALDVAATRRIFEPRYGARDSSLTRGFRAAAENALGWLIVAQQHGGEGQWVGDGKSNVGHQVGLSGLSLLALLAAGHTDREGKYAKNVGDGIRWLLSKQFKDGTIRDGASHDHTLLEHAIATHALCELVGMTGNDALRGQVQKAVDACAASRTGQGWKYVARGDMSDTNVTTWMLTALRVADEVGFTVDALNYAGADQWIGKMTDPTFGIVGYDFPGGASFRPEALKDKFPPDATPAMTAAGNWCNVLLGEDVNRVEPMHKGLDLILECTPSSVRKKYSTLFAPDYYYWYYAALTTYQAGDRWWSKWAPELRAELLPRQEKGGPWPAVDPWADDGGTVYSTAICALALLTPSRYPRGWSLDGAVPEPYGPAIAALKSAAESPFDRLRTAARQALERCPGR